MMSWKSFKGANVFMSRNLVPPELFDSLHDALKQNGAEVFLCCDPSRTAQNDYHIISSSDHEKYDDLRAKGCNLLGPHCVLFCAKNIDLCLCRVLHVVLQWMVSKYLHPDSIRMRRLRSKTW